MLAHKWADSRRVDPDRFLDFRLSSVFQPIFSLGHRRVVGFEALVRGTRRSTKEPASPLELFDHAAATDSLLTLDRQCQHLHIQQFARYAPPDRWLFLNIDAVTLSNQRYADDFIQAVMAEAGLPFHRLVIEVLESSAIDEQSLFDAVSHFRSLGALVALDDFGAGQSNFDRIWRLAPDIIKLDRSIIWEAERHASGKLRRMLPNLVALMHEAGSLVLIEGIETQTQAMIALDAEADFVQGFHLAKPHARFDHGVARQKEQLVRITDRFARGRDSQDMHERRSLSPYVTAFRAIRSKFARSDELARSCESLLAMPGVIRCSLFNENGEPIVQYDSGRPHALDDKRFRPVIDCNDGAWMRRRYFRDAINQPRRVQVSPPYLSSTDGQMCVMISIANTAFPRRVFCCKVVWEDFAVEQLT